jgi:ATP-dependent Clp protease adapter protein ClpS
LDYTERKLVGTWHYEDAYVNKGIFSSEDLMHEYDSYELILNDDFTVVHFVDETLARSTGTRENLNNKWTVVTRLY